MKTRKFTKIMFVLFVIGIIATSLCTVFAGVEVSVPTSGAVTGGAKESAEKIVGALITIIQVVAFGAAVIMLMFLGIKYITASPDGKAEIKKSATQYIVGAVILFAATGILQIVKSFAIGNIKPEAETTETLRLLLMK